MGLCRQSQVYLEADGEEQHRNILLGPLVNAPNSATNRNLYGKRGPFRHRAVGKRTALILLDQVCYKRMLQKGEGARAHSQ